MAKLRRVVGWKTFGLYGLGNILGAGIYVLVGEVAGVAGDKLIWAFLIAGFVALFTALTYSALASKYPVSAGAAIYAQRAFSSPKVSFGIGIALAASGVVSAGVLLNGFYKYSLALVDVPRPIIIGVLLLFLTIVAIRGIAETTALAVTLTLIEAAGLVLIVFVGFTYGEPSTAIEAAFTGESTVSVVSILLASFLAFYAFVGFEDMVNIAEEIKEPKKSIKKGMLMALGVASIFYFLVALASLAVLSAGELADSDAPLADVFETATGSALPIITVIGLFAVVNGVLAQIVMSSRVLYGLSKEKWLPKFFSEVSKKYQTPVKSTIFVATVILIASLSLELGTLAQITSFILLIIFTTVQLAAIKLIKQKQLKFKMYIPVIGVLTNLIIMGVQIYSWLVGF